MMLATVPEPYVQGAILAMLVAIVGLLVRLGIWTWRCHELHCKTNAAGMPLVYFPPSLEQDMERLTSAIRELAKCVDGLKSVVEDQVGEVSRMPKEVVRELAIQGLVGCKKPPSGDLPKKKG